MHSDIALPPDVVVRAHELDTVTGRRIRNMALISEEVLINDVHQLMDCAVAVKVFPCLALEFLEDLLSGTIQKHTEMERGKK